MSWNIGDNRYFFLKLKSKMRLYHVGLTKPRKSAEKITLTLIEIEQLPDIESTDSKNEIFCLKRQCTTGGERYVKTTREREKQFGYCRIPLPKQRISERFGDGTKNDNTKGFFLNECIS